MKPLSVPRLATACLAVIACLASQAGASDWANSYPRQGFAAYNYPAADYGYAGYGYGGYVGFGGYDSCAGCNVKVHNHHRPLGYRCGPGAGGSCSFVYGYPTTWGHFHRCHLWRTRLLPCSAAGCGAYGPTFMDPTPAQPQTGMPTHPMSLSPPESLQAPPPLEVEPPLPADDSST